MSQFANELDRVLRDRKITARELSERSGVDNSKLSRIRQGQTIIKPHDLAALVQHACENDKGRATLLAAYLRDWLIASPAVNRYVRITVAGREPLNEVKLPKLHPRTEKAITAILQELPTNRRMQQAMHSIADFITSK